MYQSEKNVDVQFLEEILRDLKIMRRFWTDEIGIRILETQLTQLILKIEKELLPY